MERCAFCNKLFTPGYESCHVEADGRWFCCEEHYQTFYREKYQEEAAREDVAEASREQARAYNNLRESQEHARLLSEECDFIDGAYYTKDGRTLFECGKLTSDLAVRTGCTNIRKEACEGFADLRAVTIPDTVREIGEDAFRGCKSLKKVVLSGGVEEIGNSAFSCCEALEEINIPSSVKKIGDYAFNGCEALEEINIPSSVKKIGANAFQNCKSLEMVFLSGGLEEIGNSAFSSCEALEEIDIPSSVKKIGASAFQGCKSLEMVFLSGGVEEIGNSAFSSCEALEEIDIPSSVKKIEANAFANCTALEEIGIPSSVKEIGWGAFSGCSALEKLTIAEGVKKIGGNSFSGCSALKSVTIPKSVESIEDGAFVGTAIGKVGVQDGCKVDDNAFDWKTAFFTFGKDEWEWKKDISGFAVTELAKGTLSVDGVRGYKYEEARGKEYIAYIPFLIERKGVKIYVRVHSGNDIVYVYTMSGDLLTEFCKKETKSGYSWGTLHEEVDNGKKWEYPTARDFRGGILVGDTTLGMRHLVIQAPGGAERSSVSYMVYEVAAPDSKVQEVTFESKWIEGSATLDLYRDYCGNFDVAERTEVCVSVQNPTGYGVYVHVMNVVEYGKCWANRENHPWTRCWTEYYCNGLSTEPEKSVSDFVGKETLNPGRYYLVMWHQKINSQDVKFKVAPAQGFAPAKTTASGGAAKSEVASAGAAKAQTESVENAKKRAKEEEKANKKFFEELHKRNKEDEKAADERLEELKKRTPEYLHAESVKESNKRNGVGLYGVKNFLAGLFSGSKVQKTSAGGKWIDGSDTVQPDKWAALAFDLAKKTDVCVSAQNPTGGGVTVLVLNAVEYRKFCRDSLSAFNHHTVSFHTNREDFTEKATLNPGRYYLVIRNYTAKQPQDVKFKVAPAPKSEG